MLKWAILLLLLITPILAEGLAWAEGPDWVPPPTPGVQAIQNSPTHAKEVPATAPPVPGSAQPLGAERAHYAE